MVYAAWRKRIPAALTEADAQLGLANRLSARFARRVFLAYDIPERRGSKYRVVGRPIPATRARLGPRRRARGARASRGRSRAADRRRARGSARAERAGGRSVRCVRPRGPARLGRARLRIAARPRRAPRLPARAGPRRPRRGVRRVRTSRSCARAARCGSSPPRACRRSSFPIRFATADHQTLNARYFAARRRRDRRAGDRARHACPTLARSLLDDPARLSAMSERMRALARPDAATDIAEELIALARSA